jgi:hypothetical protein
MKKYIIAVALTAISFLPIVNALARQDERSDQPDPAVRQRAAEELARLVALDQKKLVEGYLLQEKDKRVRLALSWALYRMGKSALLFQVVRDLDSGRHDQAVSYLSQLESADVLYEILKQEDTRPKVVVGLLQVIGRIGDEAALQQIKQFEESYDPNIADAAKESASLIQQRLGEAQPTTKTRPRKIEKP